MIISLLKYLLNLIGIVAVQLLIVSNIEISTYINPFVYVAFIFLLPFNIKAWQVVLISFFTGGIIDAFTNTPGLHMAASTLVGYIRGFYLKFATTKEDMEGPEKPGISSKGFVWFVIYVFVLTFIHHIALFFLEIYSISEFFSTVTRAFSSTLMSVVLIIIGHLFFYKPVSVK
ncbi:MAG: rod shape-determining protein MreD [Bacteroidia bacterium]